MCVGGGAISSERVYVHVVKFIGGDYVHVVKFIGGIMSMLQNSWGDVHVYKFEQGGGGLSWGYCPTLSHCALYHFNAPHRESMRYLNVFRTVPKQIFRTFMNNCRTSLKKCPI